MRACGDDTTDISCVDLSGMGSNYLASIPTDPKDGTAAKTGYALIKKDNGAITIISCGAEAEGAGGAGTTPVIQVTR